MAKKAPKARRTRGAGTPVDGKSAEAYKHKEEKLLLRPDVGLQAQFRKKKPLRTYRYDPSLDPSGSTSSTN